MRIITQAELEVIEAAVSLVDTINGSAYQREPLRENEKQRAELELRRCVADLHSDSDGRWSPPHANT